MSCSTLVYERSLGVVNFGRETRQTRPSHWSKFVGLGLVLDNSVILSQKQHQLLFFFLNTKLHQTFSQPWGLIDDTVELTDEGSHQSIKQPSKNGLTVAEAGSETPPLNEKLPFTALATNGTTWAGRETTAPCEDPAKAGLLTFAGLRR
jgi:hypothetical protein